MNHADDGIFETQNFRTMVVFNKTDFLMIQTADFYSVLVQHILFRQRLVRFLIKICYLSRPKNRYSDDHPYVNHTKVQAFQK